MDISSTFPRYTEFDPAVPVWCVTPNEGRCLHRFFDTSPVSPAGRFLACIRMPFEDRLPRPGETAQIVLVDLKTGVESVIAETAGWDTQMGANINWGGSDDVLFFNDVDPDTWLPLTVRMNPHTKVQTRFGRGIYHVSPDGKWGLCSSLEKMRRTQIGYGMAVPEEGLPVHWEVPGDDGLFLTNLETGDCSLLVSLKELMARIPEREKPAVSNHCYYGFHAKWSPTGDRLLFTVRGVAHPWALHFDAIMVSQLHYYIFTMKPDGSEIACATDATFWSRPGHHINFHPDGQSLTMNNEFYGDHMRFVQCDLDGGRKHVMLQNVLGSGHPTVHKNGTHILTDVYGFESLAFDDGTTPLRWIDLQDGAETQLARIRTRQSSRVPALRIDPHPAWDRSWRYVAFNAAPDGTRRVFLMDMSAKI